MDYSLAQNADPNHTHYRSLPGIKQYHDSIEEFLTEVRSEDEEMEDIDSEREIEILKGSLPDDMSEEVKSELYKDIEDGGFCWYGEQDGKGYYRVKPEQAYALTGERDFGRD